VRSPEQFATRDSGEGDDCSITGGRRDPPPGFGGNPSALHLRRAENECLLDRILGQSMSPNVRTRLAPTDRTPREDPADQRLIDDRQRQPAVSTKGQTSIGDEISRVTFDAQPSASSRSAASMM